MTTYIPSLTLPRFVFEQPAISIALPMAVGAGIGYSTRPDESQKLYRKLKQPPFNPPGWLFGPVWTALYATMGYTAWRAWTTGTTSFDPETVKLAKQGATLYTIQLALNFAWMPLFFGFYRPIEAAVDLVALGGVTSCLTYVWGKVDPVCGWLLAPYLGWLGFATYLCVGCGYLNNWDFSAATKEEKAE
ncbi:benzodiazepine receptor family protein-like protein [Trematosphaeria pertusa]|uniref:Benzodiazepine receptor family protein-like protein n=1 Tax=Trematosphaeria pertusa TaxID=390896 RepID=A0A6A6ISP3_9PLEO|nr:benzodiazepine receptor family protein-like protein [Trematosphaeria pertusa]KAF2253128.1 benzodiazepine receptor family protein-like protein [Trematosphaeria pertusa]